ncbi:FAD:protein FMN transferase [Caldimonas sp.]|uniref:FAD:protein FMN transferase n=1 Tax=Caldimonas sp. TaxID=2838790 RepID=UPI00391BA9D3
MSVGLLSASHRQRLGAYTRAPRRIASGRWWVREAAIMGTRIRAELWADDERQAQAALAAVMAEMHRIDAAMSPHRADSELSRINREAGRRAVPLSEEMYRLIEQALAWSARSGGAFDISYAAVGRLYDYRLGRRPDEAALARARQAVGWQYLDLDPARRTLRFARPDMCIDLGGFAKGHAVDGAVARLRALGIGHAMVAAGGDSRVLGDRRGRPWTVAIRHPRRTDVPAAVLPLQDVSISTSGDYERYFIDAQGRRHHHLIDPASGRSPDGVHSVTVIAPDGLSAEALSKCVFVMGVERGLALVQAQPGADAVVVDARGHLQVSAGLQGWDPVAPPIEASDGS